MPYNYDYDLPKPKNDVSFENLVKDVLNDGNTDGERYVIFGRKGQSQFGVDVKNNTAKIAVQCKCKTESGRLLTIKEVDEEIEKFENGPFRKPPGELKQYEEYMIATTSPVCASLQLHVDELQDKKPYNISVLFWPDIVSRILDSSTLMKTYYPEMGLSEKSLCEDNEFCDEDIKIADEILDCFIGPQQQHHSGFFLGSFAYVPTSFPTLYIEGVEGFLTRKFRFDNKDLNNIVQNLKRNVRKFLDQFHCLFERDDSNFKVMKPTDPTDFHQNSVYEKKLQQLLFLAEQVRPVLLKFLEDNRYKSDKRQAVVDYFLCDE